MIGWEVKFVQLQMKCCFICVAILGFLKATYVPGNTFGNFWFITCRMFVSISDDEGQEEGKEASAQGAELMDM